MISTLVSILNPINSIPSAYRWLRNIPLIESQARTITALEAHNTAIQTANSSTVKENLALQETITAQQSRIREMKEEMLQLQDWDKEKERYELVQLPPATYVYSLKSGAQPTEPPHYLCTRCYENKKKSILQQTDELCGQKHFTCFICEKVFKIGHYQHPSPQSYIPKNYNPLDDL